MSKKIKLNEMKNVDRKLETPLFGRNAYVQLSPISQFLYDITIDCVDYDYANNYFKQRQVPINNSGCSVVCTDNFTGRDLDWFYNWDCEFWVHTPACDGRYASNGTASSVPGLTKQMVESGQYLSAYNILPFFMVDGINEYGVYCSTNVVPEEKGNTTITIPTESKTAEISMNMVVRYVLDHYKTAQEAVEDLQKHIAIYKTTGLKKVGYDAHYEIRDTQHKYVVEIIDNQVQYQEQPYITNFHCIGVTTNSDGKVYTPATQDDSHNAYITNHITKHGSGLERWNVIVDNYNTADNKENMVALMKDSLNYKKAYSTFEEVSDPFWNTEFVGVNSHGDLCVDSPEADYDYIKQYTGQLFINRNRNQDKIGTWHTTHTCIYDHIEHKTYFYDSSEDGVEHIITWDF